MAINLTFLQPLSGQACAQTWMYQCSGRDVAAGSFPKGSVDFFGSNCILNKLVKARYHIGETRNASQTDPDGSQWPPEAPLVLEPFNIMGNVMPLTVIELLRICTCRWTRT